MGLKLGKKPARPGAVSFLFRNYFNLSQLPTPPAVFGHQDLVVKWGILGNDEYGDCVWAGAAHETMLWLDESGDVVPDITTDCVLSDYSAATGFNPNDPSTDQGTDMAAAAAYRRKTGIVDVIGQRHTIDSYVALDVGNLDELAAAAYLLGACGIGIEFPASAMDQFRSGQPWDVVEGSPIEGGHYVPVVGRAPNGNFLVVTWGVTAEMTPAFYRRYNDESLACLSLEMLANKLSPEGFNAEQLRADLAALPQAVDNGAQGESAQRQDENAAAAAAAAAGAAGGFGV